MNQIIRARVDTTCACLVIGKRADLYARLCATDLCQLCEIAIVCNVTANVSVEMVSKRRFSISRMSNNCNVCGQHMAK